MTTTCDVVVVGLGPGGEAVATRLARAGLDVVAVDERLVGGECPYFGCVPTKMMVRAADALAEARRVHDLAGSAEVRPDWGQVARRISEQATDGWDDAVAVRRLEDAGARFVRGHGALTGERTVVVGQERFEARKGVVLDPGTAPAVPPVDGLAQTPYWTNRDAVRVEDLPAMLAVLGGGAIGAELAQAFGRFGVSVTVIEAADRMLAPEEPEASQVIEDVFAGEGIDVLTGASLRAVQHDGRFHLRTDDRDLDVDRLLVATGRRPNLADLGLDTVGLDPGGRVVDVDERMRAAPGLWALGDVTGKGGFTHVSMYQADVCVADVLGEEGPPARYHAVPRVTFTDPEVGSVGMTERAARDAGLEVRVGITDLAGSTRGWIAQARGLIKVVEDSRRGVLVGATVVGPAGGEVLSMLTTAVHAEVPTATLESMIYAYPTFHRAVQEALRNLG